MASAVERVDWLTGRKVRERDISDSKPFAEREFIPPLSVHLLARLTPLKGKAWAVYLILHQQSTILSSRAVELSSTRLSRIGVSRWQKYEALDDLESAGLISVERRPRKNPLVTLLEEKL